MSKCHIAFSIRVISNGSKDSLVHPTIEISKKTKNKVHFMIATQLEEAVWVERYPDQYISEPAKSH